MERWAKMLHPSPLLQTAGKAPPHRYGIFVGRDRVPLPPSISLKGAHQQRLSFRHLPLCLVAISEIFEDEDGVSVLRLVARSRWLDSRSCSRIARTRLNNGSAAVSFP